MFRLLVFYEGDVTPRLVESAGSAAEVLLQVRRVLDQHPGCERVDVMMNEQRLFAVDCAGNRIP